MPFNTELHTSDSLKSSLALMNSRKPTDLVDHKPSASLVVELQQSIELTRQAHSEFVVWLVTLDVSNLKNTYASGTYYLAVIVV